MATMARSGWNTSTGNPPFDVVVYKKVASKSLLLGTWSLTELLHCRESFLWIALSGDCGNLLAWLASQRADQSPVS